MKGRRILYVDTGRSFGGAERVTLALASGFAALGAEVACVADPGAEKFRSELGRLGIAVRPLPETDRLRRAPALTSEIKSFSPHIVHIHRTWPLADRYAGPAARRGGARVVVATEHVRWEACGLRDRAAKGLLARFDDRVVAVSEAVKRSLVDYWKLEESRVRVIRNGIDARRFRAPRVAEGETPYFPRDCRFRLGSVGRLERQKGFDVLLDALARVRGEEAGGALAVAGEGSLRGALEERARGLGLAESARFAGAVPDIASFFAGLDLFVLPSRWEGLPLTLLEAMAAGVPVVATAVDGSAEAVRDGIDGLLVPPENPEALASAILSVRRDPGAARRRAETARSRVEAEFTEERMIERYREAYEA
jgi:glycosyltransferase involved in cell wall biosynthesis